MNRNLPPSQQQKKKPAAGGGNVLDNIKKLEQQRDDRRRKLEEMKQAKAERLAHNEAMGKVVDAEYDMLIEQHKSKVAQPLQHVSASQMNLCVCVRKRPLFDKEYAAGEIDCVSASNPKIIVHECKIKVDGITKYIENHDFKFDNVFSEQEGSNDVYEYQIKNLLPNLFKNGVVTCFAYGQTGSGKTFTVSATTQLAVKELFQIAQQNKQLGVNFYMSFFEIYGGKVMDLLNGKKKLQILEDKFNRIQVQGLEERQARSDKEMLDIIDYGHSVRTTHQTAANDTSSRSHAICQINLRDSNNRSLGKLLLVDLAGSERAQDTQSNNRQRRIEGAEINKSLLALKECIRAIDMKSAHVPFRASKLTMVLRDSFLNEGSSKIVMIACINPGSTSADHTLNTLRYALRLKSNSTSDYNMPVAINYQQPKSVANPQPQVLQKVQQNIEINKVPQQQPQKQPVKEEKKRPAWVGVGEQPSKQEKAQKIPDEEAEIKQKKKEDWNYLKNTISMNPGEQMIDPQLLTFHEKVDRIVEEEEELRNKHLQYLKEAAQLLTEEGELISNVQGIGAVEYDIDEYVNRMEKIIKRNIEIYSDLQKRMTKFKKHLREEEEAHQNIREQVYKRHQSTLSIQEQIRRAKLEDKEKLYDFELVTFLKNNYELSYQQASKFIAALKGLLGGNNADLPYIHREDFMRLFLSQVSASNLAQNKNNSQKVINKTQLNQRDGEVMLSPKNDLQQKTLQRNYTSANLQNYANQRPSINMQEHRASMTKQTYAQACNLKPTTKFISIDLNKEVDQKSAFPQPFSPQNVSGFATKRESFISTTKKPKDSVVSPTQLYSNITSRILASSKSALSTQGDQITSMKAHKNVVQQKPVQNFMPEQSRLYQQSLINPEHKSSYLKQNNMNVKISSQTIHNQFINSKTIARNESHNQLISSTKSKPDMIKFNILNYQTPSNQNIQNRSSEKSPFQQRQSFFSPQAKNIQEQLYSSALQQRQAFHEQALLTPKIPNAYPSQHDDNEQHHQEETGEFRRKLSFSNQNKVNLLKSTDQIHEEMVADKILGPEQNNQDHEQDNCEGNYKSVVFKSNSKSRSNSFIRASPQRYFSRNNKADLQTSINVYNNSNHEMNSSNSIVIHDKPLKTQGNDVSILHDVPKSPISTGQIQLKEYIEEMKKKFQDMNQQFDRRHSELFKHGEENLQYERQGNQKQEQYDSKFEKKLKEAKYTAWHEAGQSEMLRARGQIQKSLVPKQLDQISPNRQSVDHFQKNTYSPGGISCIEQSRMEQSSPQRQQTSKIRQRMREIQEEFSGNYKSNQELSRIQASPQRHFDSPKKSRNFELGKLASKSKQEEDSQTLLSNSIGLKIKACYNKKSPNKQQNETQNQESQIVPEEETVPTDVPEKSQITENHPQVQAQSLKMETQTQPRPNLINNRIQDIRRRLNNDVSQERAVKHQESITQGQDTSIIEQQQESNIVEENNNVNEAMSKTFAMDVNESFGNNKMMAREQIRQSLQSQDLDQQKLRELQCYQRMYNQTDPDEILKEIKEGVQRQLHDSVRNLRNQNSMNNESTQSFNKHKQLFNDSHQTDYSEASFSLYQPDYLEKEKQRIQTINEEVERQEKLLSQINNQQ